MMYTLEFNGASYELPPFTKAVRKAVEGVTSDLSSNMDEEKKYMNEYVLVKKLLGDDGAEQMFGTDNIDEIDLNDITVAFIKICHEYDKPVNEVKRAESKLSQQMSTEDLSMVMELIKNADNISNIEKMLQKRNAGQTSRVAFRSV